VSPKAQVTPEGTFSLADSTAFQGKWAQVGIDPWPRCGEVGHAGPVVVEERLYAARRQA